MANVSEMSVTKAHEAAPARVCAFLNVLPAELRLYIYEMALHGSRVHAVLALNEDPSSGQHHPVRFRHSVHFNLLLSCPRIYDEALPTNWSETVLSLAQPDGRMWALAETLWGVELAPDSYSYHLCSSLPEVAKMNVRHIRSTLLPSLDGAFVVKNPSLTAAALLSNFKSLASCEIAPMVSRHSRVHGQVVLIEHRGNNGFCRFKMKWGQRPAEFLVSRDNTDDTSDNRERFDASYNWAQINEFLASIKEAQEHEPKNFLANRYGIEAAAQVVFLYKTERQFYRGTKFSFERRFHRGAGPWIPVCYGRFCPRL